MDIVVAASVEHGATGAGAGGPAAGDQPAGREAALLSTGHFSKFGTLLMPV